MCLGTYIGLNLKLHVCEGAHHIGGHFGGTIVEGTGITLRSRSEGIGSSCGVSCNGPRVVYDIPRIFATFCQGSEHFQQAISNGNGNFTVEGIFKTLLSRSYENIGENNNKMMH